jgi:malate/lactate dehydrogenase
MTALVLGLVTASAKQSFDDIDKTVRNVAADVLTLHGVLARYGPETAAIRASLKTVVDSRV